MRPAEGGGTELPFRLLAKLSEDSGPFSSCSRAWAEVGARLGGTMRVLG